MEIPITFSPIGWKRINRLIRPFTEGYEARLVTEHDGIRRHWVLLHPMKWVEDGLVASGFKEIHPHDRAQNKNRNSKDLNRAGNLEGKNGVGT